MVLSTHPDIVTALTRLIACVECSANQCTGDPASSYYSGMDTTFDREYTDIGKSKASPTATPVTFLAFNRCLPTHFCFHMNTR